MASDADDLYEVLGLAPGASDEEIDAAYSRLQAGLTASAATSPAATEVLRRRRLRLANAYAILGDPEARAAYDVRQGLAPPVSAAPAPPIVPAPAAPNAPPAIPPTPAPPQAAPAEVGIMAPPAAP